MNDTPSHWTREYLHSATLVCPSCDGSGMVQSFVCGACEGKGEYAVTCGGVAEMDLEHPALGGYCVKEQRVVPVEELSRGRTIGNSE